jgi:subtilase family serine protease
MDKGSFARNKVYDDGGLIYIICNKPELIYVNGSAWLTYSNASLWPPDVYTNQSVNLSIKIMNYGPVDSGPFWVRFNGTTTRKIDSLKSEEIAEVPPFPMNASSSSGAMLINISIDYNNSVDESIETNNNFTVSLNVKQRPQ